MFLERNEIYEGDARELIYDIEPASISCSMWSPPYHVGKEYEKDVPYETWRAMLKDVIRAHYVALKPGGFMAINIADILAFPDPNMPKIQALNVRKQKSKVTRQDVLAAQAAHPNYNRYQLAELLGCSEQTIDRRLNGNNIRGGKYATQTRVHLVGGMIEEAGLEAGLFLYDRRVWHKDPAWENSRWHTLSYRSVDEFEYVYIFWKPGEMTVDRHRLNPEEWIEWGSRGVWSIPSVRSNTDHVAKFPIELPRRLIKLLTDPGETILDCFMGSGTTAVAAIQERRDYIGIERHPEYVELARRNCERESKGLPMRLEDETQPTAAEAEYEQESLLKEDNLQEQLDF